MIEWLQDFVRLIPWIEIYVYRMDRGESLSDARDLAVALRRAADHIDAECGARSKSSGQL